MSVAKGRIIILDDSQAILDQMAKQLTEAGFEVFSTSDVVAAARQAASADVAIVDYHMGSITGFDAIKILKKSRGNCRFFLYTTDADHARTAVEHGFDGTFSVKGNLEGLVRQVAPAVRASQVRARMRANGLLEK